MEVDNGAIAEIFEQVGDLEKEFAEVELKALRRKEYALKPLFQKRQNLIAKIPEFWPAVFLNGPEEVQQFFSPVDLPILSSISSFSVDRYQIKSEIEGEPRSLRFTFEFNKNEHFEDVKVVKDFEYRSNKDGTGNLISKPVSLKWKSKKDITKGLLGAASDLYSAEEALRLKNDDQELDIVDREALWQHEKLMEKLASIDEQDEESSFVNWFGFRGAILGSTNQPQENGHDACEDDDCDGCDDGEDDNNGLLEVEIFPPGEELAISLAEEFWPNVMDYYPSMTEPTPDFDEDDDASVDGEEDSDDEVPDLVVAEEAKRPQKKQRTS